MNESTLTQLKIIVERAVRPVRASIFRKRKMREELLAHVSGVFEEESAQLGDDRAALERTALRFGRPTEVTGQLQESVPFSDGIRRFWEGRPGESTIRTAFRLAWVSGTLAVFSFVVALFAVGSTSALPLEALIMCLGAVLALPVYLFGLAFLTDWMEKALYGPTGRSRFKVALVAAGSWVFTMLWCAGLTWRTWPAEPDYLAAILFAAWLTPMALLFPYALAKSSAVRIRYHEEWARLPLGAVSRSTSMNESTLTQLKIIVERAVRPVRASTSRKRKMREELLAHVSGVFDEEFAQLGDDRPALERTALRFGNPAEVTGQLQESVPAGDGVMRFLEGRPGESILRGALRFAWVEGTIALVALAAALFAAGWQSAWSREELITVVSSFGFLPLWLFMPLWLIGIAFSAHWMEKSLHGPEPLTGWPRIGVVKLLTSAWAALPVRFALIVGGLCLLVSICIGGPQWPTRLSDWNHLPGLAAFLLVGFMAASSVVCAWVLVQTVNERRRSHEEWSRLPIEPHSYS